VRALRKLRPEDTHLELVDVDPPAAPAPGWAVLDVTYAGICGTDVHITHNGFPSWPPVTLGHEFTGVVAAVTGDAGGGAAVGPGQRVVCEPHALACTTCHLCRRGLAHLCASKRSPGWGIDGGMAERVAVPAHLLHAVPDSVGDVAAAMCEPTAVVVTGFERTPVPVGGTVLVVGPGPVGILSALVARACGAGRVVLAGRASSAGRLELARSLGIEAWTAPGEQVVADALEATGGRGFDLAVETSGSAGGIATCVGALRRRGALCVLGVPDAPDVQVPWGTAMSRAIDVAFSLSSSWSSWDAALALMDRGAVDPTPLATVYPLREWQRAFSDFSSRAVVKALVDVRPRSGPSPEPSPAPPSMDHEEIT